MASPSLSPVLIQFSNLDTSRHSIFPPAPQQPTLTKNYSPTNKYTKSIKLKRPARGEGRPVGPVSQVVSPEQSWNWKLFYSP